MSDYPFVSILLPIYNEISTIDRCLQAVLNQTYPPDRVEILVADGGSDDGTCQKLDALADQHPRLRIMHNPGRIVSKALNLLTNQARGEVIIRVDGHCVIAPDYVANCVRRLAQEQVDVVGGPMRSIGETETTVGISIATSSKFGVGYSAFRVETGKSMLVDTVPFPACTRAMIARVGLYDEELVRDQDDELNYRIRKAGGKVFLADEVRSDYYSRSSLKSLWKQYFEYGVWKVRVMQKHPQQMRPRQFVPFAFVMAIILGMTLSLVTSWGWQALLGLLGVYALANLTASLLTAWKKGWAYLMLLPIAFVTLHLSYGIGFLVGLVRFWNRWGDQVGNVPELDKGFDEFATDR